MKLAPITKREQPHVVDVVAGWKPYQVTRYGFLVQIVRIRLNNGSRQILWAVTHASKTWAGQSYTVTEAIDLINGIICAGHHAFLRRFDKDQDEAARAEMQLRLAKARQ
jgi:hypothetical protein